MTRSDASRLRTRSAIIDAAATILAARGELASMDQIAASAGIGRATLYRYFASREQLVSAMAAASVHELAARLADARLDTVPFDEAIARLARTLLSAGAKFAALGADSTSYPAFDAEVAEPLRSLFRRGFADGALRHDIPADVQLDLFSGLIRTGLELTDRGDGVESTAAAITSVFLRGAQASS